MKKIYLLVLAALLTISAISAQDCNIGNETAIGVDAAFPTANFIVAYKFNLPEIGTLNGLAFVGRVAAEGSFKMALYQDNAGVPGELIVETATSSFTEGTNMITVANLELAPGDYWIARNFETGGEFYTVNANEVVGVYYIAGNYADPFPASFALTDQGDDFISPIFAQISCGTVGTYSFSENNIKMYPNPTTEKLYFAGMSEATAYSVFSMDGNHVASGSFAMNAAVNVAKLSAGMYFIKFENGATAKFVKE